MRGRLPLPSPLHLVAWIAIALPLMALTCQPIPTITIHSPLVLEEIASCEVAVQFELVGAFVGPPVVTLNFSALSVPLVESPPGTFSATLGPDDGLSANNLLLVSATRMEDGESLTQGVSFGYSPNATARVITDPADLITGPLGHSRIGDYLLESCKARFIVQDVAQRDLYSVGQYGGNLIDAELKGRPGIDNFLEVAPMVNIETVLNPQTAVIVNDGADGNPAIIRTCGPDDLLDFVNPSSIVTAPFTFPASADDLDQPIEGCTDFELAALDSHIKMETTLTNLSTTDPIGVFHGDWLNPAGDLDFMLTPNSGLGAALINDVGTMSFHGVGEASEVDYAYTSDSPEPGSYFFAANVLTVLHNRNVLLALIGMADANVIAPGESLTMTRFIGVGSGSASAAVDLEVAIKGIANAQIEGCVTVAGMAAPGSKVTVGSFNLAGILLALRTHFTTDETGCYSGSVPLPGGSAVLGVIAGRDGTPYQGGAPIPPPTSIAFAPGALEVVDFDLPETGSLMVSVTDETSSVVPARITVVGFDPSPEILIAGPSIPGLGGSMLAELNDPNDRLPFGVVAAAYTGADGVVSFDLEPGVYQVYVSRGTEYSATNQEVTITAGNQANVNAQIALVLDTSGFVSSDFHVHGINSADSRVSHVNRVEGYAGEGVDNIIMTDHHAHTDLDPAITLAGLDAWVSSTIGEEITTADYGHFNGYPFTVDASRASGGSTDWAQAAPPGMEFPSAGAFNATPAEIFTLATTGATSTPDTTVQINHITSHFVPLKINTRLIPPVDALDAAGRLDLRLDAPVSTNLFFPFPALELWNGDSRGSQDEFLTTRMGIWFNLLNQGIETTFIADTDSHRFTNLNAAGARTWTAAAAGSDEAGTVDAGEVANMVDAGKATGGQGVFVTTVLRSNDGSGQQADLTRDGSTHLSEAGSVVDLDIRVQSPIWAQFDRVEIYVNADTEPVDGLNPYLYSATPAVVFNEGDCDPATTGDGQFDISVVNVAGVPGGDRLEANITIPGIQLSQDVWFVVVVKGTDGVCEPMFPIFASSLDSATNSTLSDLVDGNLGESGVMALGVTNALYFEAP